MRETSIILFTDERNVSLLKFPKLMVLNCIRFIFVETFVFVKNSRSQTSFVVGVF